MKEINIDKKLEKLDILEENIVIAKTNLKNFINDEIFDFYFNKIFSLLRKIGFKKSNSFLNNSVHYVLSLESMYCVFSLSIQHNIIMIHWSKLDDSTLTLNFELKNIIDKTNQLYKDIFKEYIKYKPFSRKIKLKFLTNN